VPVELVFAVKNAAGERLRFLQYVHERPMHLIVVSNDLADFAHVHPELGVDDDYRLLHEFPRAGRYRMFADYTPAGSGTIVDHFDVEVAGTTSPPVRLVPDSVLTHAADGVRVTLVFDRAPRAGDDVQLTAALADSATGAPVTDLQLYLGALAHFIAVSADLSDFIHAHPFDAGDIRDPSRDPTLPHTHDPALLARVLVGPSPSSVRAVTSFPRAGRYKLWMQFQRAGHVSTVPFVFDVAPAPHVASRPARRVPAGAVGVVVSAGGYEPARIELPFGEPATLAFTRPTAGNCGGVVVIPALGIRRELAVGDTVLIRLTPTERGEIPFQCGMGMLRGLIVVR
jgi:hypothetical protein